MIKSSQHIGEAEESSTSPLAAADIFDGVFADKIRALPDDIWKLSETDLAAQFSVGQNDFMIRKNIHKLVAEIRASGVPGKVHTVRIYDGICSRQNFMTRLLVSPYRLAWYLLPIHKYEELIEDGLYHALRRVRDDLLTLPMNEKTAPVILKALEFFAVRHLGPIVQRIEQKNMNLNVNRNETREVMDPEDMMRRHAELKAQLSAIPIEALKVEEPT